MRTCVAVTLLVLLAAGSASAQVTVNIDPGAGKDFADKLGIDLPSLQKQAQTEIEHLFQTYRLKDYLRSFGDAQAFTTRGLGVDYGANFRWFEVGVAANVSVNAERNFVPEDVPGRPPVGGLATNLTAMAGLNLGMIGLRPITLYGNYFAKSARFGDLDGHLDNYGAHVQLRLFGPSRHETLWAAFVRWGGIDVTSGVDHSRMTLGLSKSLRTDFPLVVNGEPMASVTATTMGSFDATLETWSIPLEVTTSFRLLYIATIYGGAGFDWQLGGQSDLDMKLQGSLHGDIPSQNVSANLGGATIAAHDSAVPSAGKVRGIFGVQATVFIIKVFAQVNFIPQDPFLVSVAFGGRLLF